jgi:hypothetical protein
MGMAGERICHPVVSDKLTRQCMCCYFFLFFLIYISMYLLPLAVV